MLQHHKTEVKPVQSTSPSRYRLNSIRAALLALSLVGVLIFGMAYLAGATPLAQLADDGQALFQQKCSACHTIGSGKMAGPDLKGVTARRDREWLARFISAPDKMLAQKDPTAAQLLQEYNNLPMPNLGLSDSDVTAILAYLDSQGSGTAAPPAAQAPAPARPQTAPAAAGDAVMGRALFTGERPLQNGGAACVACHSAAGIGALGGGALGPDLTQAFNKFGGDAGMASLLAGLPFPTMKPIFETRPLTPEEQASIGAFLKASTAQQPVDGTWMLILLVLAVLAALLILAQAVWSRKLVSVRKALIEQTRARGKYHQTL